MPSDWHGGGIGCFRFPLSHCVLGSLPTVSASARGEFWDVFSRDPVTPFALSDRGFTRHVENLLRTAFSIQKPGALDCKNMQTVSYILKESRMRSLGRTASQMYPKVMHLVPECLLWELQNVSKIVVLRQRVYFLGGGSSWYLFAPSLESF